MQVLRYTHPLCHFWFVYVWNIATAKCLSLTSGGWGGGGVVGVLPPLFYQGKTRPQKMANGKKSNCPKFAFFCFSFWIKETFKENFTKSLHARFLIQRPFCIIRRKLVKVILFKVVSSSPRVSCNRLSATPPKQTNKQTNERRSEKKIIHIISNLQFSNLHLFVAFTHYLVLPPNLIQCRQRRKS